MQHPGKQREGSQNPACSETRMGTLSSR